MIELICLIFLVLILCIIVYNMNKIEPFEDTYFLRACPTDYKTTSNANSDTICCKGDIVGNKCMSSNICTLSGEGTQDIPSCVSLVMKSYEEKGKSVCPSSMKNYYESSDEKGCTNGQLSKTLSGPANNSQEKCIIYNTEELNNNSINSCLNSKHLDDYKCFGKDCVKKLTQPNSKYPVLITVEFTDNAGLRHSSYTKESYERFLFVSNPSWKDQGIDLSKNISVAEVAKAYYVDKTMSASDIQN